MVWRRLKHPFTEYKPVLPGVHMHPLICNYIEKKHHMLAAKAV